MHEGDVLCVALNFVYAACEYMSFSYINYVFSCFCLHCSKLSRVFCYVIMMVILVYQLCFQLLLSALFKIDSCLSVML